MAGGVRGHKSPPLVLFAPFILLRRKPYGSSLRLPAH